jgi:type I restriction enzyme S subunit
MTDIKKIKEKSIPKGWIETPLGNIIELVGGGTPKTTVEEYWNGNIPWLSVTDFNNGSRWVSRTEKTITEQGLKESSTKLLNAGDLIISARGTVGALAQLKINMTFNQSCYGIKEVKNISNKDFLFYLIKNSIDQIGKNVHGAVFDTITKNTFDHINVLFPPLLDQKDIANILSSFDNKIELLRNQNKTLEETAQTIFKEWFGKYSFDIPEALPDGWRVGKVTDIIERESIPYKCIKKDVNENGKTPIFDQGSDGLYGHTEREPDFIASPDNPVVLFTNHTCNYWFVDYPFCAIQNVIPYRGKDGYDEYFIYFMTKGSIQFIEYKGHWPDFEAKDFVIPSIEEAQKFSKIAKPILEKISTNKVQIQSLEKTRDTLLPKLMRGDVSIK